MKIKIQEKLSLPTGATSTSPTPEYNLSEEAKPKFLEAARMQHRQIYSRSASRLSTVCVFRARITIQPAAWGKKGHVSLPGEVLVLDLINYRHDLSLV